MGANYTRQSTYADGDTINAADTNDEFDQLLAAFAASTGHTHDGTTGEGGPISALVSNSITFGTGADTDIALTFDANSNDGVITWKEDEDYFEFSDDILLATTEKVQFRDTAIHISSSTDGQLDLVADTEIQLAATTIDMNGNVDISGTIVGASTISAGTAFVPDASDGAALGTSSLEFSDLFLADAAVINLGADQDTTLTHVADTGILLNSTRQLQFGDSGTYIHQSADGVLDLVSDTEIEINATTIDVNGALDVSGASTLTGNVTLGAQLRMPDNTASKLLIADGTSYEEKAVGDLSEISTVANDDVFLAVDTSGGGLKKITRSTIVAGLAASGAIANVVDDSTPQLGGSLDVNGEDIVSVSNGNITLTPNGSGVVRVDGTSGIDMQSGAISIKNSGAQSYVRFYCESSNAHYAQLQAPAHADFSGDITLTLPNTAGTLIGTGDTASVSNSMLATISTAGKVDIGALEIDGATDIGADLVDADLVIVDDGANGTERKSELTRVKKYIYSAMSGDATASDSGALTIANDAVESGMLNDNVISGQTELASGLADTDELLVSDAGTIKRMDLSVVKTYLTSAGFSTDDPTALAIALG